MTNSSQRVALGQHATICFQMGGADRLQLPPLPACKYRTGENAQISHARIVKVARDVF